MLSGMSPFEIMMLVCFGASWPLAAMKTYRAKTAKGKSLGFITLIFIGYIAGTLHKVFYKFDLVIILYILNGLFVFIDLALSYHYHSLESKAEEVAPPEPPALG